MTIDTLISCFPDRSILKVTLKDISHNYLEDDGNQSHELIIRSEMWIFALQLCIKVGIIGVPGSLHSSSIPASSGVCLLPGQLLCLLRGKYLSLSHHPSVTQSFTCGCIRPPVGFPKTHCSFLRLWSKPGSGNSSARNRKLKHDLF